MHPMCLHTTCNGLSMSISPHVGEIELEESQDIYLLKVKSMHT